MFFRIFGWSLAVTAASLVAAYFYGGATALVLCLILGVLEVSLSFDNAVVNATILRRMSRFWQQIFLTVGILIAVFGMRLVFPVLIVSVVSGMGPLDAVELALAGGDAETPGTYANILSEARPQIAGFGGMFLLMLFLDFMLDPERETLWLRPLERLLGSIGRLDKASILVASVLLVISAQVLADDPREVLLSGLLGLIVYLAVNGLGTFFESAGDVDETDSEDPTRPGGDVVTTSVPTAGGRPASEKTGAPGLAVVEEPSGPSGLAVVTGRAAFFLFLYLEVLDATFSFDGVIGAFAITSDLIIIALGLGLIGAMFVRSITVYLVRRGTLDDYVYLESGAHWAIGALALILLLTIGVHVDEVITGLVGVLIIAASFISSLVHNRRASPGPGRVVGGAEEQAGDATGWPREERARSAAGGRSDRSR